MSFLIDTDLISGLLDQRLFDPRCIRPLVFQIIILMHSCHLYTFSTTTDFNLMYSCDVCSVYRLFILQWLWHA